MGGAFFGESMFSRATDASKAALVHLAARLRFGGFKLLDAQFITPHLEQFGAQTLPRRIFHALLGAALEVRADFGAMDEDVSGAELLALSFPLPLAGRGQGVRGVQTLRRRHVGPPLTPPAFANATAGDPLRKGEE